MAVLHVKAGDFDREVLSAKGTVLVDLWAEWCGPCMMLGPVLEQVSEEAEDVKIVKVNVDTEGVIAEKYNVMSIPTLLLFKDGELVNKQIGFIPKEEVLKFIGK